MIMLSSLPGQDHAQMAVFAEILEDVGYLDILNWRVGILTVAKWMILAIGVGHMASLENQNFKNGTGLAYSYPTHVQGYHPNSVKLFRPSLALRYTQDQKQMWVSMLPIDKWSIF